MLGAGVQQVMQKTGVKVDFVMTLAQHSEDVETIASLPALLFDLLLDLANPIE
jgi:hypothetical protein